MAAQEPRKLFVGGLPRSVVSPDSLRCHFARYGEVVDAVVMLSPEDGQGRGFGFVEFADEAGALRALDERERPRHVFDGRRVDVKRAQTRHIRSTNYNPNADPKKIFVGGLRDNITEVELRLYFEKFGKITDCVVMYDKVTRRPRGFGFVRFDSQEAADKVLENKFHDLDGTKVETKNAEPKDHRSMIGENVRMCSPCSVPYVIQNGPYLFSVYQYNHFGYAAPHYGYMNQADFSNYRTTFGSPGYGRSPVSIIQPSHPGLILAADSKTSHENGNSQKVDISVSTSMKLNPGKPDFANLLDIEQDNVTAFVTLNRQHFATSWEETRSDISSRDCSTYPYSLFGLLYIDHKLMGIELCTYT
ncbi:hypothetical protein ACP70R_025511 [Stipagrostis hirtigluma subsp. patula]